MNPYWRSLNYRNYSTICAMNVTDWFWKLRMQIYALSLFLDMSHFTVFKLVFSTFSIRWNHINCANGWRVMIIKRPCTISCCNSLSVIKGLPAEFFFLLLEKQPVTLPKMCLNHWLAFDQFNRQFAWRQRRSLTATEREESHRKTKNKNTFYETIKIKKRYVKTITNAAV